MCSKLEKKWNADQQFMVTLNSVSLFTPSEMCTEIKVKVTDIGEGDSK